MDYTSDLMRGKNLHGILFTPSELRHVLAAYSEGVLKKGWKDYAVDSLKDQSIFSVIDHQGEEGSVALYSFSKNKSKKSGHSYFRLFYRDAQVLRTESFLEALEMFRAVDKKDPKGRNIKKNLHIVS